MGLLGAHMSIAGGYYKAANAAGEFEMECVQIFTKNNNQWKAKELTDKDVHLFRESMEKHHLSNACSHSSYLINMASPKPELWQKSVDAYVIELERAERLGLGGVVIHPGSYVESSPEEGLDKIVRGIDEVLERTDGAAVEIWLETTAGQGSNLGYQFPELQYLIDNAADSSRIGICIDTCHIHAAGYKITTEADFKKTMQEFDELIGTDRIRAFHLNDSKKEFGSRKDRHEHIGEGTIGVEAFRFLVNDKRFAKIPMYMETPKGERDGMQLDAMNLQTLRDLIKSPKKPKSSSK
ncbi:Endonuclease 4 [Polystyrenella longa]|uniref:Probable endonuclease 4 n=1 Tax=Polystyrenella longa TaxID=2528007 RepID=A0A518CPS8_9PLAN|nr:deoxyribonuclease IV [Polystyrenella longa]QDU81230.1 Endonuclease 4 [Polystyrenella longa]